MSIEFYERISACPLDTIQGKGPSICGNYTGQPHYNAVHLAKCLNRVYSKTCVKWLLKNRQNKGLNDK